MIKFDQLLPDNSHLETPADGAGSNFLDRIVRGLYFWNIILATVSDNSVRYQAILPNNTKYDQFVTKIYDQNYSF